MNTQLSRILAVALLAALPTGFSMADDGSTGVEDGKAKPVLKSMSKNADVQPGGVPLAEHAFLAMMKFYVPAQEASGATTLIDYLNREGAVVTSSGYAKPLIGAYHYGPAEDLEGIGFIGHGKRDAFGAVSLDDGLTWKPTNLSESASETSCDGGSGNGGCEVQREDVELFTDTDYYYPGDVINIVHSIAGNKVLVAWPSRYCASGQPNFSLDQPDKPDLLARRAAIAAYLGIDLGSASPDDLYLLDMYGVAGQQGSVDYAEDKWEANFVAGEVPFACLWTARGELVAGDDPRTEGATETSYMRWFKAERLTSGRRDVNRVETVCVAGAGCAITWQEDPEGLRPGQGEGPGEGWSGAIANSQTDVWYSYIPWAHFDVVQNPTDETGATPMTFAEYEAAAIGDITQKPKPFVPFAMPMRLTDNAKCNVENPMPYCYGAALAGLPVPTDGTGIELNPVNYGLKDMCATTVEILIGNENSEQGPKLADICVTEDGLPLLGNNAVTRPRLGLYGYASSGKLDDPFDSAFVVVVAEEDKGLGKYTFELPDGSTEYVACEPTANNDPNCVAFDEGKNIKYFSFSMSLTDSLASHAQDGLLANLTRPGNQLNQPEVNWETGSFYPLINTSEMWDFGDYNYDIYNTEIARRGSLLAQDIYKAYTDTKDKKAKKSSKKAKAKDPVRSRLIALPTWKQGVMNQGGPADVMSRRILIPAKWQLKQDGNPYAFRNMECSNWLVAAGTSPYYPDGLCGDSAINLSATIPDACQDSDTGESVPCPTVAVNAGTPFGVGDTNPILQGLEQGEGNTTKVLSWHQCPASFSVVSSSEGVTPVTCETDTRTTDATTLLDQSWYNPLDVAKGHRGFIDGDFVMMLYAWSPNWRLNAKGNDRYELYIRRSFDGGKTWTTLPGNYKHWDGTAYAGAGTTTCETFRTTDTQQQGDITEPRVCNSYAAGAAEQARNVTQHKSMRITTLDPRYAITGSPQGVSNTDPDLLGLGYPGSPFADDDDERDPTRFFVVYETGDNTTTEFGEPEPLDLHYGRAVMFGDHYQVWAEETDLATCYPSDPHGDDDVSTVLVGSGFCNEFDQMEQGIRGLEASEASLQASPSGQFLYGVWAQELIDEDTGELVESDAMLRRVWWLDGYIPSDAWVFGQGSGDGEPANP